MFIFKIRGGNRASPSQADPCADSDGRRSPERKFFHLMPLINYT